MCVGVMCLCVGCWRVLSMLLLLALCASAAENSCGCADEVVVAVYSCLAKNLFFKSMVLAVGGV